MDRTEILSKAAGAVTFKLIDSNNNYRTAKELDDEYLMSFWAREIQEFEEIYQGLVELIHEMSLQEGSE